ncbi:MAG: ABC transporter ATP-binding protein [Candidatus Competibacterales bacterium]
MAALLTIEDLWVHFDTFDGPVAAVRGVDLTLAPRETVGVVGESGSGKSQLFLAVMGLLAANGRATGRVQLDRDDLLTLAPRQLDRLRGSAMTMVFQDPMTSLNPYLTIQTQLGEVLSRHRGLRGGAARRALLAMLERVGIPDAPRRLKSYPFQLSGGMRQRVMIAMALLGHPKLLIADEPTTALDVTIQAQILSLLADIQREFATTIVLISHDLGVVAGLCHRVMVMYAGRVVEMAPVAPLFHRPLHPYTRGLLAATPRLDTPAEQPLLTIGGQPPSLGRDVQGCAFAPRCPRVFDRCYRERPELDQRGGQVDHQVACHWRGFD